MSFVIYNRDTTVIVKSSTGHTAFKTERAVRAAMTRLRKAGTINESDYGYAEAGFFSRNIEKSFPVRNLLTGVIVMETANTPRCCSVGSELYFSM